MFKSLSWAENKVLDIYLGTWTYTICKLLTSKIKEEIKQLIWDFRSIVQRYFFRSTGAFYETDVCSSPQDDDASVPNENL